MQAAPGVGIISSAVLMSDDQDEIDWEWSGNDFATGSGKVQTNYFGKGITGIYDRGTLPAIDSPQTKFHTYKIDWTPTTLTRPIDGKTVRVHKAADSDKSTHQYSQSPSKFHLGLWCAGDPDMHPATAQWAGGRTDFTEAPFTAYVQSVKIANMNPCSQYEHTDKSGDWQSIKCLNTTLTSTSSVSNTRSSSAISSSIITSSSTGSFKSSPSVASSSSSSTSSSLTKSSIVASLSTSLRTPSSPSSSGPLKTRVPSTVSIGSTISAPKTSEPPSSTIPSSTPLSTMTSISSSPPLSSFKPTTSASPTTSKTPPVPAFSSTAILKCSQDNCLRNLADLRYASSATALCKTYTVTTTSAAAVPTWLSGCSRKSARVKLACSCLMTGVTSTTGIAVTTKSMDISVGTTTAAPKARATTSTTEPASATSSSTAKTTTSAWPWPVTGPAIGAPVGDILTAAAAAASQSVSAATAKASISSSKTSFTSTSTAAATTAKPTPSAWPWPVTGPAIGAPAGNIQAAAAAGLGKRGGIADTEEVDGEKGGDGKARLNLHRRHANRHGWLHRRRAAWLGW